MSELNANWGAPEPGRVPMEHTDLAGFWIRLVAHICDQLSALIVIIPVGLAGRLIGISDVANLIVGSIAGAALVAYWTAQRGGSPLRARLGVLVLDEADGSFLDMNRSLQRAMFPAVLSVFANLLWVIGIVVLMDYLSALTNKKKQTWHDRIARSVVVNR